MDGFATKEGCCGLWLGYYRPCSAAATVTAGGLAPLAVVVSVFGGLCAQGWSLSRNGCALSVSGWWGGGPRIGDHPRLPPFPPKKVNLPPGTPRPSRTPAGPRPAVVGGRPSLSLCVGCTVRRLLRGQLRGRAGLSDLRQQVLRQNF
ncbi:hypothetical protein MTO96_038073 [Rhipicephalus appendiculatus]